jgi:hypothetical protein
MLNGALTLIALNLILPTSNILPAVAGTVLSRRNLFCFAFIAVARFETAVVNSPSSVLPSNKVSTCALLYVVAAGAFVPILVFIVVK